MPPPVDPSDEEHSDQEPSAPRAGPSSAKSARVNMPCGIKERENRDYDVEHEPQAVTGDVDEDEDEEAGEDGEEEYIVESILDHAADKYGEIKFLVKWATYPLEDATWEPEAHLEGSADEILAEYLKSLGGRENLLQQTSQAVKSKKRARQSSGAPTAPKKRRSNAHPADGEAPLTTKAAPWKPPPGSWEDHIARIDACEDEETGKLMIYLQWNNGQKTQHDTKIIYQRCPQKMLQYYEQHVRIVKNPLE